MFVIFLPIGDVLTYNLDTVTGQDITNLRYFYVALYKL
jgi:hypothetical protein